MRSFENQTVLITGAGSGIGRQLACVIANEGARIAAVDLNPAFLTRLAEDLQGKPFASTVADVTDVQAMRAAVPKLESQVGPTDILIANAGIGKETTPLDFRAEDITAQINVNLIGVANTIDAVLPGMRERRRGHLVAISSLASFRGLPHMAGYCASKAGVNALMDSLRVDLQPFGIVTTTICPGWIKTPLTADIDVKQLYMMEVEYAVSRMVEAIRTRQAFVAFPAAPAWQVRILRWLPSGLSDFIIRRSLRRLIK